MQNKRILIITYYWPPSAGVGVHRWMHFAINLQKMGWEPIIYTPSNPQFDIKDEHLLNYVKDLRVIKEEIWEPFNFFHKLTGNKNRHNVKQGLVMEKSAKSWKDDLLVWIRGNLFVPDPRKFWIGRSVKVLKNAIHENEIRTIITTGPPHSMHLIGYRLKKAMPELNWISDFRDPWSDWDVIKKLKTSRYNLKRHQNLERKVLTTSDLVLTVSNRLAQNFRSKGDAITVKLLTNGISDDRISINQPTKESDKFVIGYFGMLNEIRDPHHLWDELEIICKENPEFNSQLEIRLGGIVSESIQQRLLSSKYLKDKVVLLGYLTQNEVFEEYSKASLLLLLLNKSDNAQWILPMKFFEYLSAGKPILSLGDCNSELNEMFQQNEIGGMYEFEQVNEFSKFILSNFENNYSPNPDHMKRLLEKYSRSNQTKQLNSLLENL